MSTPAPAVGRWTSKRTVVSLGVLGGALAALAASQPWGTGTATTEVVGVRTVTATGGQLAPLVPALALVGAAAAVAVATTGRFARRLAAGAVLLAGVGVLVATAVLLAGLATALGERAASLAATQATVVMTATATAWPWLAVLGGALLAVDGVLALLAVGRWPAPSRRYERPGDPASARELTLWEQVGREVDDTPRDEPDRRDPGAVRDASPRT